MAQRFDVLVVGGGPAGTAAAVRASELGARVAVAEARRLGGTCVNTGCVPTRVLAKAARMMRDIRDAGAYGIVVDAPELAWDRAVANVRAVIEQVQAGKRSAEQLQDIGAELFLEGRAELVDAHTVALESGRRLEAAALILCVGGHSRLLPIPGADLAITAERVLDLERFPASVAVVGSGSTGVQLVTIFNAFGAHVTLLEVQPRILPAGDADVARVLSDSFRRQGVDVVPGIEAVDAITPLADGRRRLGYRLDGERRTLDVDQVVLSVGWPAAIDGLGLEAAGVATERGRIPVNSYLQTNVEHIYAPGDANGDAMLVQAAAFEAEAAATNAVLGASRASPHHLLPSGGFTDPDIAGVGLTEAEARARDPECLVALVPYGDIERAVIDRRTTGFLKLIADRRRSQLLGAHAAGENAIEVIQAVTAAMAAGVDVATLARVEFAYPTYTAIVGAAAARLLGPPRAPSAPSAPGAP